MLKLLLTRIENTEDGVFGYLGLPNGEILQTMEDDWKDNQRRESCIPAGVYRLKRSIYHKHGYETFWISDVPGRTRCLFHPANTEEDVEGCIGIGMRRGVLTVPDEDTPGHPLKEKNAVVSSREAFRRFMESMAAVDEAELTIEWQEGLP